MELTAFRCEGKYPIKISLVANWHLGDKFMLSRSGAATAKVTVVAGHRQTLFNVLFPRRRLTEHAEPLPATNPGMAQ